MGREFELCCWTFDLNRGPEGLAAVAGATRAPHERVTVLDALLLPSPQSPRWEEFLEKHGRPERTDFERLERWIRAHGIRFPSVLRVSGNALVSSLDGLVPWVHDVVEASGVQGDLRGFVDRPAPEMFPLPLAPEPALIPELARKFDRAHPILVGPPEQLLQLRADVAEAITAFTHVNRLAVLGLNEGLLPWAIQGELFLPLPDRSRADSISGGAQVGDAVRYSKREYLALVDAGFAEPIGDGWTLHLLITQPYLQLLGIDEDEMLVELMQTELSTKLKNEIDHHFAELESEIPQRVVQAHFDVYRRYFDADYLHALHAVMVDKYIAPT